MYTFADHFLSYEESLLYEFDTILLRWNVKADKLLDEQYKVTYLHNLNTNTNNSLYYFKDKRRKSRGKQVNFKAICRLFFCLKFRRNSSENTEPEFTTNLRRNRRNRTRR